MSILDFYLPAQGTQAAMTSPEPTSSMPNISPAIRTAAFAGEKRPSESPPRAVRAVSWAILSLTLQAAVLRDVLLRCQELFGLLPLVPVLIYQITYMNSFCPMTEGWFSVYASLIRAGALPYRDFALLLPPAFPFFIACLQAFFGVALLPLHWLGFFITSLIGLALYLLLRAHFPVGVAGVAAAIGLVYYQSGNAFIGYDFTQIVTLLLLLSAMMLDAALVHSLDKTPTLPKVEWRNVLAGIFLALAILTKHSNAGVCAVVLMGSLAVVFARFIGLRHASLHLFWLACGLLFPFAIVFAWLAVNGIVEKCFAQLLFDAAGAKGGVLTSLTQWIPSFFTDSYFSRSYRILRAGTRVVSLTLLLVVGVAIILRSVGFRIGDLKQIFLLRPEDEPQRQLYSLALASIAALIVASVILAVRYDDPSAYAMRLWRGRRICDEAIPAAVNLYLLGGSLSLFVFLWHPTIQSSRVFLLLAFGVGLTCGNGTSSGLSEISCFLGVALITALLLRAGLPYVLPTIIPMTAAIAFVTFLVNQKYENPYHWWSIVSRDIRHTESRQLGGILAGLSMPPEKCAAIESITNAIVRHSNPGEAIYVFPHMPIFHLLADRPAFKNAVVSWFDFMSNRQAEQLAESIDNSPPAVIIFVRLPEEVFETHERFFRGGGKIAQRRIVEIIDGLVQSGRMKLVAHVDDLDGVPVAVYASADSAMR